MLFATFLTLVAAAATTVFGETSAHDSKAKACSRELEAIVFSPPNCAHDYLREISRSLVVQAPLLWTDRAASVIETFKTRYGVGVAIYNAFGTLNNYYNVVNNNLTIPQFSFNYERTAALGEAFAAYPGYSSVRINVAPFYAYSTLLWNANGEMLGLGLIMNKTDAPISC